MNAPAANIVQIEANRRLVLEALAQSAAPADRVRIAKLSGLNADTVAAHLADLERAGIVERFDQGARKMSLWSLLSAPAPAATDGEPGDGTPAPEPDDTQAEDRRRAVLEALREAPEANADSIASATGLSVSEARFFLHAMAADGIVERIEHENAGAIRRNPTIWRIVDADQPGDTQVVDAAEAAPVPDHSASLDDPDNFGDDEMQTAAPDPDGWIPWHGGECPVPAGSRCSIRIRCADAAKCVRNPEAWWWGRREDCQAGDGDIVAYRPEPKQTGPASFDDPDDYGDDEIPPAAAYDATVEAEAKADEAPLIGEDVNSDADVLGGWCADHEMAISPRPVRGDDVAMIVSADGSVSADMPALRFAPPATGAAVASGPCPTVALLIQRASPVAEEAARRAIDAAEVEALMREEEADIALEMARDARVRGRAVAEIIRFAEQRAGLAGDADPDAVLAAIVELLDGARSAVTGMSLPA